MSRQALDIASTVLTRVAVKSVNLLVFVILARTLSIDEFGLYGYVFATSLVLATMFDVGLRNSSAYFIGKQQIDAEALISHVYVLWAVLAACACAAWAFFLAPNFERLLEPNYLAPSLALVAALLFVRMFQGVLLGKAEIKNYNASEAASRTVLGCGTVALFAFDGISLSTALWLLAASHLAAAAWLSSRTISAASLERLMDAPLVRRLLARGAQFVVGVVAMQLCNRFVFFYLSYFGAPEEMGAFFGVQRLSEVLTEISLAIAVVAFSHGLQAKSDAEAIDAAARSSRVCLTVLAAIAVVAVISADWVLPLVIGPELGAQTTLFRVVVTATLIGSVWAVLFPALSSIESPLFGVRVFLPALVGAALWTPVLHMHFGLLGAAAAHVVLHVALTSAFLLLYSSRYGRPVSTFLVIRRSDLSGIERVLRRGGKRSKKDG